MRSPKVPICSTSPTKIPSANPLDVEAAIYFAVCPLRFKIAALSIPARTLSLLATKYFPSFFDCMALLARLAPLDQAPTPGTPRLTKT